MVCDVTPSKHRAPSWMLWVCRGRCSPRPEQRESGSVGSGLPWGLHLTSGWLRTAAYFLSQQQRIQERMTALWFPVFLSHLPLEHRLSHIWPEGGIAGGPLLARLQVPSFSQHNQLISYCLGRLNTLSFPTVIPPQHFIMEKFKHKVQRILH